MVESLIRPKRPTGDGWTRLPDPEKWITLGFAGERWLFGSRGISVISAVEVASDPNDIDRGPEYHLSISRNGGRCTRNEARFVIKAFAMDGAEEDNHVAGGFVRNFWRPVNEQLIGIECPCKADEPAILEDKGDFTWRGVTK